MDSMIGNIFEGATAGVEGTAGLINTGVNSITSMFVGTNGSLTVLGTLLTITIGTGIVFFAFNLIRSLIRRA